MNLRDQLKKAKLLSDKDAKRLAHEERVHRKAAGHSGLEAEKQQREAEITRLRAEERSKDQARQLAVEASRRDSAEYAACEAILDSEVRRTGRNGFPWYFELPDGRLPQLRIDDAGRHQLESGHVCIVRRGAGDAHVYGFLATQHAQRVHKTMPERIVWSARGALKN